MPLPSAKEIFQDTAFGYFARLLSGGRILGWEEESDPNTLDRYMSTLSKVSTRAEQQRKASDSEKESDADDSPSRDPEKSDVDYELLDWVEGDIKEPRNWSRGKKFFVTFQLCLLTTSVYIGSAIYTAGLVGPGSVTEQFGVSDTKALLGLTLFVAGYGLGPMVWAPLSEMPYFGRNPIYIGTLVVFVALQPAVIYAKNFAMLLAFRFITGLFGSPVLATGGASIADLYSPSKRAYGISIWGISAVLGPVLGPLVGGFAAEAKGWTWTIWELMWASAFCLIVLFFFLPETSASNIMFRRTARLRAKRSPDQLPIKCTPEIEAEGMTGGEIVQMILVRPFTMTFFEPILLALNLYIALLYAMIYLWFESFPIVFVGYYQFTLGEQGLAFVGILLGAFLVLPPFWWYLHKYTEPQFNAQGELTPELRLPPAIIGGICLPICFFWFGWSAGRTHWIVPILGTIPFSIGAMLLFNSVLNYIGDAYPKYVASAYAGNDLLRSAFGAAFPLFAAGMYHKLGIDWGSTLLALLSMLFIPVPIILVKYGKQLRLRSKMARHDL